MVQDTRSRAARVAVLAVIAVLTVSIVTAATVALAAGPAAAQPAANNTTATPSGGDSGDVVNATDGGIDTSRIVGELGSVTVHRVTFNDGNQVSITVTVPEDADPIAITDSGAVDVGSDERRSVPFEVYRPDSGTHTLTFTLSSDDQLITIQEGEEMMVASGDRGVIDILAHSPGVNVVRWSALGGGLGVLMATAVSGGILKRRHHNSYKELLSEERTKVQEGKLDGVLGKITSFLTYHRHALLVAAAIVGYLVAARLGVIASPGEAWGAASDAQRVAAASAVSLLITGFIPAYALVNRVWDPATEFIFDVDARDVLDAAVGAKGGLQALEDVEDAEDAEDAVEDLEKEDITVAAVYSGSPERVADMRVSGEPAEVQTAGGPGHLVQDFNPAQNTAEGTWPGLADDFELARERSKIDSNREILEDYATVGRRIIGALPAIRAGADTSAVQAVDRKFAAATAIDSDPVDDIMDSAVSGTRFERYYSNDPEDDDEEYEDDADDPVNDDETGGEDDE